MSPSAPSGPASALPTGPGGVPNKDEVFRLEVLFSAVLRFRFGEPRDGLVPVGATLPNDEAEALVRAMGRVERDVPGDCRTRGQRDCDRLVAVTQRVLETVAAVHAVTDTGAA